MIKVPTAHRVETPGTACTAHPTPPHLGGERLPERPQLPQILLTAPSTAAGAAGLLCPRSPCHRAPLLLLLLLSRLLLLGRVLLKESLLQLHSCRTGAPALGQSNCQNEDRMVPVAAPCSRG